MSNNFLGDPIPKNFHFKKSLQQKYLDYNHKDCFFYVLLNGGSIFEFLLVIFKTIFSW